MFKKILTVLVAGLFILGTSKLSFAMMCGSHSQQQQTAQAESREHKHTEQEATVETAKEATNVGNKICPVSGEKIKEEMKATYEYEGKIYNFCCAMCIDEFKKDPQKYIKKIEEELQTESKEETKEEEKTIHEHESSEGLHEGHHH